MNHYGKLLLVLAAFSFLVGCPRDKGNQEVSPTQERGVAIRPDTTARDTIPSESLMVAPLGEEDPEKIRKAKEGGESPEREIPVQEDTQ